VDRFFSTLRSRLSLGWQGAVVGKRLRTSGPCFFKLRQAASVRIGNNVTFIADIRSNRVGLTNPVVLETLGDGEIEIGDFSGGSSVVISSRSKVVIGKHVLLGGNVRIFDHDFHALDFEARRSPVNDQRDVKCRPITIGDDVLIGTNVTVLKGVYIGDRVIIGAGSVVTCDVPADEVWAGNPVRFIKKLGTEKFA
jgi:acetyltransferase-like isoleucine patch superfamily enzyme